MTFTEAHAEARKHLIHAMDHKGKGLGKAIRMILTASCKASDAWEEVQVKNLQQNYDMIKADFGITAVY